MTDPELREALNADWLKWSQFRQMGGAQLRKVKRVVHITTNKEAGPIATLVPWDVFMEMQKRIRR